MNTVFAGERLLRLSEVRHITGLSRSSIYAMARIGRFVAPIKISERCSAWPESKVRAWIQERIGSQPAKAAA